jgi:competence protein ComEA
VDAALPPDDDHLDRLLRPPRRGEAVAELLARLRRLDRRTVLVAGGVALAVAVVVAVVVVANGPGEPASVTLPRVASDAADGGGSRAEGDPGAGGAEVAPAELTSTTVAGRLVVHVAGAVVRPGLVEVDTGARVADALAAAGGAAPTADLDRVNLASPLADGMRVYVPAVGQTDIPVAVGGSGPASGTGGSGSTDPSTPAAPVDLNSATEAQLETLPGVGPATAAAILAYRSAHGPFADVDSLDEVRGIGPAKLGQLRDLVVAG